jgi:CHAD domain-containing protein
MDQEQQNTVCGYIAGYMLTQVETFEHEVDGTLAGGVGESTHLSGMTSRRLRNSLRLLTGCIPGEKLNEWQDEFGRITRILKSARDLDIRIDFLNQVCENALDAKYEPGYRRLSLRLKQKRDKVEEKLIKAFQKLQGGGLLSEMREQLEALAASETKVSQAILEQAYSSINQALDDFIGFQMDVHAPDNADKLHAMRIAGKNLLYTMEVFAPVYSHILLPYLRIMQTLQEELGEIHENDVWVDWLPKFIKKERTRIRNFFGDDDNIQQLLPGLRHLIEDRKKAREEVQHSFLSTWEILAGENAWQVLVDIIKPPLADETSPVKTGMGGDSRAEIPEQGDSQEHVEFEVELSPEDFDEYPNQENSAD